jgi:hypothetical protein
MPQEGRQQVSRRAMILISPEVFAENITGARTTVGDRL